MHTARASASPVRPTSDPAADYGSTADVAGDLEREGIARVGAVLNIEQIARVLAWLQRREADDDALVKTLQPQYDRSADGRRRLTKVRRLFWGDPAFWSAILVQSRILTVARELAGPAATLLFHTAFMKPSAIGSEVALHQDQGVTPWQLPYALTLWVALTPSRVSNGCVIGYPGSHLNGLIPHELRDGTPVDRMTARTPSLPLIPPSRLADCAAVAYEVDPGEALIWHHFFVHGSAENRSTVDRKGIAFVFADAARPGYTQPDADYSGRPMAPLSLTAICDLAARSCQR